MNNNNPPLNCPYCQAPIRYVPAGVSKRTGKPYNEFWGCSNRECNFTWTPQKPKITPVQVQTTPRQYKDDKWVKDKHIEGLGFMSELTDIKTELQEIKKAMITLNKTLERFENEDKVVFYPKNSSNPDNL